jgi:putative redox protein
VARPDSLRTSASTPNKTHTKHLLIVNMWGRAQWIPAVSAIMGYLNAGKDSHMAGLKNIEIVATLGDRFKMESTIRDHVVHVDQPKAAGGDNAGPTPLEYLLLSIAGCIGAIGRIIANQRKLPVRSMEMRVIGELDTDALMGRSRENRAGFLSISVLVRIDAEMSQEDKQAFLEEIDARCPVSDNLKEVTDLSIELG